MKLTRFLALAAFALPVLAHAHPGHEGHELTWDFDHLVAHPTATLVCFAIFAAAGWAVWRVLRSRQAKALLVENRVKDRR
jgi:hydrogenase/urease accessory protein HupE